MSTEPTPPTPRRISSPVRMHPDNRVTYWTGGAPGVGRRRVVRCDTLAEAERLTIQLRYRLAKAARPSTDPEVTNHGN